MQKFSDQLNQLPPPHYELLKVSFNVKLTEVNFADCVNEIHSCSTIGNNDIGHDNGMISIDINAWQVNGTASSGSDDGGGNQYCA